jgi:hypothetical protein
MLNKKLIVILAAVLLALLSDRLIFTTSSFKVELQPEVLRASLNSELRIRIFISNMLGFKVPFREIRVRFVIEEGANLVEIINEYEGGTAVLRSKGTEGEASVGIYSLTSGQLISRVLIKIVSNGTARVQVGKDAPP